MRHVRAAELRDLGSVVYTNKDGERIELEYNYQDDIGGGKPFRFKHANRVYRYKTFDSMLKRFKEIALEREMEREEAYN